MYNCTCFDDCTKTHLVQNITREIMLKFVSSVIVEYIEPNRFANIVYAYGDFLGDGRSMKLNF